MTYIIDGHNLIPELPGFSLSDPDDEIRLIEVLQQFARIRRKKIEVYFDQAPPGNTGVRRFGTIKAHFIAQNTTADEAIIQRLHNMGKSARDWTVVSSDQHIQFHAKKSSASVLSSEQFAIEIRKAQEEETLKNKVSPPPISEHEVAKWLEEFNQSKKD